jgi:DNA helicase-2/ATP-dependent DNA helicase PcrA
MAAALMPDIVDEPLRLLAGPGSGKTQALVDLYVGLISGGHAERDHILVLTFSTAAAHELERRVDQRLRDSYGRSWISTFHGFCARLLREHRPEPRRMLMSPFQEWLAMRHTLRAMEPAQLGPLAKVAHTDGCAQDALAFVAMLKQNQVLPAQLALLAEASATPRLAALAAVYRDYQALLSRAGLRDFRDLVVETIWLLEGRPEVLGQLRKRFRYLLVDEFQDVDPAQFQLLRTLSPPGSECRLVVAGDPHQAIYGFRGTVPRLLSEEFARVYGGRSISLDVSHRCPPAVLEAGRALLAATGSAPAPLPPGGGGSGWGGGIAVAREATVVDEAAYVARQIREVLLEDPSLRPGDVAVLLRSTTAWAAPFEEAVRALGLPCEVRGMGGLSRNQVVRFLLAYLRALDRPDDPESLERLLGSSLSGVGPRTASRLRRYAVEEGRPLPRIVRWLLYWLHDSDPAAYPLPWEPPSPSPPAPSTRAPSARDGGDGGGDRAADPTPPPPFAEHMTPGELSALHRAMVIFHDLARRARHRSVAALAYSVLIEVGMLERVLALPLEEAERQRTLTELQTALRAFTALEEVWERLHGSRPLLSDVASRLEAVIARAVDDAEPAPGARDAVQIMTVHQSKGLEFEVVFLAGFAEGIFPLAGRPHPLLEEADQRWLERNLSGFCPPWPANAREHLAEEARLAYVGMTRARRRLSVTCADEYGGPAAPSSFLEPWLARAQESRYRCSRPGLDESSLLTAGEAETLLAGRLLDPDQADRLAALGVDVEFVRDPEAGRPFEPYAVRPAGVDPGHFSATTLNDYLRCPRIYWYSHHPGLSRPPRGVEMERGSFLHRVLEEFHRREPEWRDLPPSDQRLWLDRVLETHLERYLERVDGVLERRTEEQEVRRILGNYIRFATTPSLVRRLGTLAVERTFTLDLDGAEIHGQIDRINDTGEGTCEVVDYKTGRGSTAPRAYETYFGERPSDVQLLMYYLACQEGRTPEGEPIGLKPRFLSLWYPKDVPRGYMRQVLFAVGEPAPGLREWTQRTLTPEDIARGREVVLEAIGRIRAGDFRPAPREGVVGTCTSWFGCPHATVCPFGGQPGE